MDFNYGRLNYIFFYPCLILNPFWNFKINNSSTNAIFIIIISRWRDVDDDERGENNSLDHIHTVYV